MLMLKTSETIPTGMVIQVNKLSMFMVTSSFKRARAKFLFERESGGVKCNPFCYSLRTNLCVPKPAFTVVGSETETVLGVPSMLRQQEECAKKRREIGAPVYEEKMVRDRKWDDDIFTCLNRPDAHNNPLNHNVLKRSTLHETMMRLWKPESGGIKERTRANKNESSVLHEDELNAAVPVSGSDFGSGTKRPPTTYTSQGHSTLNLSDNQQKLELGSSSLSGML
jgi:hypothetical protein